LNGAESTEQGDNDNRLYHKGDGCERHSGRYYGPENLVGHSSEPFLSIS
jgi:hypothetical protein